MKQKTKKRIQGSVSIFLVIILVPMVCLSGLIVDGSRVQLAKAAVSSAGDLTMNSALANYDTVLKDVYGLFAMSQTEKDLQDNLYKYFIDTLVANDIIKNEEELKNDVLLQDIANSFSGRSGNTLAMEVEKESFKSSGLKNSALVNPEILKNQIVEYEKYRAPASSVLSLLDGISSLKKIMKQGKVNEAKTKVDEKSAEVNEEGESLYKTLKSYEGGIKKFDSKFDSIDIDKLLEDTIKNYYINYVVEDYVRIIAESMPYGVELTYVKENDTYKFWDVYKHLEPTYGKNNKKWTSFSGHTTDKLLEELIYAYEFFDKSTLIEAKKLLDNVKSVDKLSLEEKQSYATAYTMYMQKVYNLKNFYDAYKKQYDQNEDDTQFLEDNEKSILNIFNEAVELTKILVRYKDSTEKEYMLSDLIIEYSKKKLDTNIEYLEKVDGVLKTAIDELNSLKETIKELNNSNNNLKSEINTYNGSDESDAYSTQMMSEYEYYKNSIDPKKVEALGKKLEDLRDYYSSVKKYLENISFGGVNLRDVKTLKELVEKSSKNDNIRMENNITYIQEHISDGLKQLKIIYSNSYVIKEPRPKVWDDEKRSIKDDEFYKYLQKAYSSEKSSKDDEAKKNKEKLEKSAKNISVSGGKTASYNDVSINDKQLPSSEKSCVPSGVDSDKIGDKDNFSDMFDSINTVLENLLKGIEKAAKAGRDNLYVSQYIFDMFSYNTLEAEYKVENDVSSKDMKKSLEDLNLTLETSSGIKKSKTNNYMYGAEIEYILYGKDSAKSNIKSAKTTIFCIRFLANSGYALTNGEIKSITLPPALAVQAATAGVVPYKLTQTVLQLCLALGESANDLSLMEKGQKVALIKTNDTWVMSPSGAIEQGKNIAKEKTSEVVGETANKAKGVVSNLIDAGSEKIKVKADDYLDELTTAVNGKVEEIIGQVFAEFEGELISALDGALKKGVSVKDNIKETAGSILNSANDKALSIIALQDPAVQEIVKDFYVNNLWGKMEGVEDLITDYLDRIDNEDAGSILITVQKKIAGVLKTQLENVSDKIKGKTKDLVDSLGSKLQKTADGYIDMAADKVLDVTNNFLDSTFDKASSKLPDVGGKKSNSSVISSVLSFNYGDYLKMFIFLKLCINDDDILLRTADVIQLNINEALSDIGKTHPIKGKFLMKNAYTYIEIDTNVRLKPMFTTLPIFTEYSGTTGHYFNMKYKSVLGY